MTFADSLESFIEASPWLDETHEPDIAALRFLADRLDGNPGTNPAPLVSQWGLILRSLRKASPTTDPGDELERELRDA